MMIASLCPSKGSYEGDWSMLAKRRTGPVAAWFDGDAKEKTVP